MTLKVRILPFLTTFAQPSARLKNFLGGWLLVLGINESLVECATMCIKSVVLLPSIPSWNNWLKMGQLSLRSLAMLCPEPSLI